MPAVLPFTAMLFEDDEVWNPPGPRLVVAPAEVAASLREAFVLESDGVTLPWKTPMSEVERFAPTYHLQAYGGDWDGEFGWSEVTSLGALELPVVFVTDTRGFGVLDRLYCWFPSELEASVAGTELFECYRALLVARLGPAAPWTLPDDLVEARWQVGAVRLVLRTRARELIGLERYRTSLSLDLDPRMPFDCTGKPSVVAPPTAPVTPPTPPLSDFCDPRPPIGFPSKKDGLRDVRVATVPILEATWRFSGETEGPCVERTFRHQTWWVGSGVRAAEHPFVRRGDGFLAQEMLRSRCGGCGGHDVWVVAFQTSASMGGVCYYDLELRCAGCLSYTSFAYDDR